MLSNCCLAFVDPTKNLLEPSISKSSINWLTSANFCKSNPVLPCTTMLPIATNEALGESGGTIILCGMQKKIKVMHEKMGFSNLFKLVSSEEEAIKA